MRTLQGSFARRIKSRARAIHFGAAGGGCRGAHARARAGKTTRAKGRRPAGAHQRLVPAPHADARARALSPLSRAGRQPSAAAHANHGLRHRDRQRRRARRGRVFRASDRHRDRRQREDRQPRPLHGQQHHRHREGERLSGDRGRRHRRRRRADPRPRSGWAAARSSAPTRWSCATSRQEPSSPGFPESRGCRSDGSLGRRCNLQPS